MTADVILTQYPGMWGIESPQQRGIAAGRPSLPDAIDLASEILPGARLAKAVIVEAPDGAEYRLILRDETPGRMAVAEQVGWSIRTGASLNPEALHLTSSGEYDVVPAMSADRFGDLMGLVAEGQSALLVTVGDDPGDGHVGVASFQVGKNAGVSRRTLADLDLTEDANFEDVLNALLGVSAANLRAVVVDKVVA